MALPSLDPSIFKSFLYYPVSIEFWHSEKEKKANRTAKNLDLVVVSILYLKIFKLILLDMDENL